MEAIPKQKLRSSTRTMTTTKDKVDFWLRLRPQVDYSIQQYSRICINVDGRPPTDERMERTIEIVAQLQHQMAMIQQQQQGTRTSLACSLEGEDIEAFLTTFERTMVLQQVDEEDWSGRILPLLTERARVVYNELEVDTTYQRLKGALKSLDELQILREKIDHRERKN